MSEILDSIVYACGAVFICWCGLIIIGAIILQIKEITYDAHQNLIELNNLKRKCKKAIKEIENISTYDGIYIDRAYVLEILDKLIESED